MEEACGGLGLSPLPPPSEREAGPASAALPPSCRGLWPGQVPAHQGSGAVAGFPHLGGDTLSQDPRVTKEVCASDLNACTATPVYSHSHTVYLHSHTCLLTVIPVYLHTHTCLLTQSHLSTCTVTHLSTHTASSVYLQCHTYLFTQSHLSTCTATLVYSHSHTCLPAMSYLSTCTSHLFIGPPRHCLVAFPPRGPVVAPGCGRFPVPPRARADTPHFTCCLSPGPHRE